MKKRYSYILLLLVLLLSGCAGLGDRSVNISETQIQNKLNQHLAIPISLLKIFDVNLSNSKVKFDGASGRMHTTFDTRLSSMLNEKALTGQLGISGKLRFDTSTSSVVLDDAKVESLNLNGLGSKYDDLLSALAKSLGGQLLSGMPLYTVKPEDLRVGSTQYNPRDMQITDKGLVVTLSPVK